MEMCTIGERQFLDDCYSVYRNLSKFGLIEKGYSKFFSNLSKTLKLSEKQTICASLLTSSLDLEEVLKKE